MSICVCVCNSMCQYVPLYTCPSVSPGVCLCLGKYRCLYVSVYIMCLYIHVPVSVCVSVCISLCMSLCQCLHVSVCVCLCPCNEARGPEQSRAELVAAGLCRPRPESPRSNQQVWAGCCSQPPSRTWTPEVSCPSLPTKT